MSRKPQFSRPQISHVPLSRSRRVSTFAGTFAGTKSALATLSLVTLGALALSACSSDAAPPRATNGASSMGSSTTTSTVPGIGPMLPGVAPSATMDFIPAVGDEIDNPVSNVEGACGNGKVDLNEACDDGNAKSGDGCPMDCLVVEDHWSCEAGHICVYISFCGDAVVGQGETCDDGNIALGDGCSDLCQQEADWACPTVGQPCVSAVMCGDAVLAGSESCDDANTLAGDGCSDACATEVGWTCSVPGQKCVETCGDQMKVGREDCDDGNTTSGDGCSATCAGEIGWECNEQGCHQAVCGDGIVEGGEPCDDQNNLLGDGCSPGCKYEPDCTGTDGCRSRCGDGLMLPGDAEGCDDGNAKDGDGCSAMCQVETGFTCETLEQNTGNTLTLPIVYRDFIGQGLDQVTNEDGVDIMSYYAPDGHPDFEHLAYSTAAGEYALDVFHAEGLAETTLSAAGRPVYAGRTAAAQDQTSTAEQFNQWFDDVPGVNVTLLSQIDLRRNGAQNPYVFDDASFFPIDDLPGSFVDTGAEELRKVDWDGKGCWKPLLQRHQCEGDVNCENAAGDQLETTMACSRADNFEACVDKHNFSFTSELRYWFAYQGGEQLVFRGDDDVFVYINRKLVVDLGGLHEPLGADVCGQVWPEAVRDPEDWDTDGDGDGYDHQVLLDDDGMGIPGEPEQPCEGLSENTTDVDGNPLGLKPGTVYEVALFQAERHTCQSNYQLSLSGFTQRSSTCAPTCGDGVVASTEVCDEGAMNGTGYGHCAADCTPGPRCGDKILQADLDANGAPFEQCDNGVNASGYFVNEGDCAPGCKLPAYCGDANVDSGYSEQCDNGANNDNMKYGGCTKACQLGPRCGDGVPQADMDEMGNLYEECDDGNVKNNDGCSVTCKKEPKFSVK